MGFLKGLMKAALGATIGEDNVKSLEESSESNQRTTHLHKEAQDAFDARSKSEREAAGVFAEGLATDFDATEQNIRSHFLEPLRPYSHEPKVASALSAVESLLTGRRESSSDKELSDLLLVIQMAGDAKSGIWGDPTMLRMREADNRDRTRPA